MVIDLNISSAKRKKKSAINKPTAVFIIMICFSVLVLEFIFDLKKELFWHNLVVGLDLVLITGYLTFVGNIILKHRKNFFDLLRREKADLSYLFLVCIFLPMPRLAAGLVINRLFISLLMKSLETRIGSKLVQQLNLRPNQTLALSFIALITVGTSLLTFPAATTDGKGATLIDALFTMTSASCVTGLSVKNVGADFTRFGQGVILFGMQVGGLGIMVLSAVFAVLLGGTIRSRRQVGLREVLDVSTPEGLKLLIRSISVTTIFVEFIGAICLYIMWSDEIPRFTTRVWWAVFHSVSAFNNAGFSLTADSLVDYVNTPLMYFIFIVLIILGGLGFFVISDLVNKDVWVIKKPKAIWQRLQIQTKVVLIATILLNSLGMLLFLFFEYNESLRGLSIGGKIGASLFQAVSLRTAGFNTVSLDALAGPTVVFCVIWMFIGAAPGSTAGGVKVTTAAVSLMALRAMLRGRDEVEMMGRSIPGAIVNRSLSIVLIAATVIAVFFTLLLATQEIRFEQLIFETVSAFGTVGLSMNTTKSLDSMGKFLIVCVMYVGRIGPLTLALAVGQRTSANRYSLPKGRIAVG